MRRVGFAVAIVTRSECSQRGFACLVHWLISTGVKGTRIGNLVQISMVFSANQNFNELQEMNRDDKFRRQHAGITWMQSMYCCPDPRKLSYVEVSYFAVIAAKQRSQVSDWISGVAASTTSHWDRTKVEFPFLFRFPNAKWRSVCISLILDKVSISPYEGELSDSSFYEASN